jgi:cadmium resistance protein CadD (predicted permease)
LTAQLGAAVGLYASTNMDDLLVLIALFAEGGFRGIDIVIGQIAGVCALFLMSIILSRSSALVPLPFLGLLGLAPISTGLYRLWTRAKAGARAEGEARAQPSKAPAVAVAMITLANGGDNLCIYTPLLASTGAWDAAALAAVFAAMTALWCALAHYLVHHPFLARHIRRAGGIVAPVALVVLGLIILVRAGTVALVLR